MNAKPYPFQLGSIACTVLQDGARQLSAADVMRRFPHGTEADYRRAYADMGLSLDEADDSFNILLLKLGDETVLVDAGEGGQPYGGALLPTLQQAGVMPEAVTRVVITHTHGDHILGLLTQAGEAAFPNARYVISKEELAFWKNRIDAGQVDQSALVSMIETRGLRTIAMDESILPGLTAFPLPGHTPGQIGLRLESNGETLLHLADLLHSPMQFAHPDWSARFDADTTLSVPTRRKALALTADENALALFYHLAFPGLGRVRRAGDAFAWEPVTQ